ncbi:cytochrome C oxidase subunit III [Pseudomonas sp. PIC25]|nr:cytochrome P460 family protein [Pseudomonas sp. PIC25]PAU65168.1 cytochrome C oxidase subunit III [Pseudomonas sp. PIC25]
MNRTLALASTALALTVFAAHGSEERRPAAPIYGVELPADYQDWPLIAPAQEAAPLNELRVVVGNAVAMRAYRDGVRPFPDGTVLVKRAWKHVPSPDFAPASIPGDATTVQVMVKDAKRYAATGGWGYGRFVEGQPVDEAQHRTCHACHSARVKDRDYVFTHLAP